VAYYSFYVRQTIARLSAYSLQHQQRGAADPAEQALAARPLAQQQARTLVMYIYAAADAEYLDNLLYFLDHGVGSSGAVDYLVVVQQDRRERLEDLRLPALPSNARYVRHENECYDWGTFGWLLFALGEVRAGLPQPGHAARLRARPPRWLHARSQRGCPARTSPRAQPRSAPSAPPSCAAAAAG
jgi:hypothetical protein